MNAVKELLNKNSPYLFFFRFLICFFILYLFFSAYRGVTGPGGTMYSPFLESHFNLITGFTRFLIGSAKIVLQAFGYEVNQKNYHSASIGYSRGISVMPSCLGWSIMSFWVAFVFANKGTAIHKFKWIASGIVVITLLNISRIALITIANHLNWLPVTSLDHHATFNVASYTCIIIMMLWYIRRQKKYERNLEGKQIHRALSPI